MHHSLHGIRAVFFDAVGTLLLPAEPVSATYRRIGLHHGLDLDEKTIRQRLIPAYQRQERLDHAANWRTDEPREVERWRAIVTETFREIDDPSACFEELWGWYSHAPAWIACPDAEDVLGELQRCGMILGLASNFDGRLPGIIEQIKAFRFVKDRCVVSSMLTWRKPAAEFFAEVTRLARCDRSEILFVGDDVRNDFEGAAAGGLRSLLLNRIGTAGTQANQIVRLRELIG